MDREIEREEEHRDSEKNGKRWRHRKEGKKNKKKTHPQNKTTPDKKIEEQMNSGAQGRE